MDEWNFPGEYWGQFTKENNEEELKKKEFIKGNGVWIRDDGDIAVGTWEGGLRKG